MADLQSLLGAARTGERRLCLRQLRLQHNDVVSAVTGQLPRGMQLAAQVGLRIRRLLQLRLREAYGRQTQQEGKVLTTLNGICSQAGGEHIMEPDLTFRSLISSFA